MVDADTDDHGGLGQFIGGGIQDFAEIRDHMKFPGNNAVEHVGQAGQGQDAHGVPVISRQIGIKIQDYKDWNQEDPEKG